MKKCLIWLLILLLSVSGALAAETEGPMKAQYDITLHLEPDMMQIQMFNETGLFSDEALSAIAEAQKQQYVALCDLLNALSFQIKTDADGRLGIYGKLKEKELAALEISVTEEECLIASTLFPNFLLCATAEEMAQKEQMPTLEGVIAATQETLTDLLHDAQASLQAHIKETETGEYAFEGYVFTEKNVIEMPAEELFQLLQKAQNRLIPLMEKVYAFMGEAENPEAMEQALADTQEQEMPEEWQGKTLTLVNYSTADETAAYVEITFAGDGVEEVVKGLGTEDALWFELYASQEEYRTAEEMLAACEAGAEDVQKLRIELTMAQQIELKVEGNPTGTYEWLHAHFTDGTETLTADVQYGREKEGKPLLSLHVDGKNMQEEMPPFQTDGKEKIYYMQLMEPAETTEGEEEIPFYENADSIRFLNDMSTARNGMIIQAILAAPEEVQAYMNAETALSNAVLNSMQHIHWEEVPMEIPDGEDLSF